VCARRFYSFIFCFQRIVRRRPQCAMNGNPPFLRYRLSFYATAGRLILASCQAGFADQMGVYGP
jgi:hypothetical protein